MKEPGKRPTRRVTLADVGRHGTPETIFFNVNDAADLRRAQEIAQQL